MPIVNNGLVFSAFSTGKNIPQASLTCASSVVESLLATRANAHPGLLLGKVQSGKTRTFITALALAFDNGFDLAVVFTKGVKVLTQQTVARISREFEPATVRDLVSVFEIMAMQENLPPAILSQRLVIVCKKEDDNIDRLHRFIDEVYPSLKNRRCLVIDDEADFASVGYRRDGGVVVSAVIPAQIDRLRQLLRRVAVLQVTATPYALYLQPNVTPTQTGLTRPIKPSFTHLVPCGRGYIGGEVYFERSQDPTSIESLFHVSVSSTEMHVLSRENQAVFRIHECLDSPAINEFRQSIVTFLLGGFIRRWQVGPTNDATHNTFGEAMPKYAFIVHSETAKASHLWQVRLVEPFGMICTELGLTGTAYKTLYAQRVRRPATIIGNSKPSSPSHQARD